MFSRYNAMKNFFWVMLFFLVACTGVPQQVTPVDNFDVARYMGTWYEIARLDHSFERNLNQVTAHYQPRDDGGVNVINRGYNPLSKKWSEATGKAYFVNNPSIGHLKVSFFWPFYGSYVIIDLDNNYQYALICGYNNEYLWILSKTPTLDKNIVAKLVTKAATLGFNTDNLIYVDQQNTK